MTKISKPVLTIAIIVSCVAVFAGIKYFKLKSQTESLPPLPQRAKGNPNGKVRIIEFIDFQCPACANGVKILNDYLKKYPNEIYLELRYFPLVMHRHGNTSARYGECAARQEKFWPFLELLLERQKQWSVLNDPVPAFEIIAKEVDLNVDQLNACLQDPGVETVITADVDEGKLLGVKSTPAYFINHEMVVGTKLLPSKLDSYLKGRIENLLGP